MATLRETQTLLWRLITAPEGVGPALAAAPEIALDRVIRGDERLSAAARLDVYANMYFFRLLDCLKEDFPALRAIVGADDFHDLVTDYLLEHPSESPSVRDLGRALAAFLDRHPLSRERPFLADLARLEWAELEAFDAADAEPLAADALRALAPEAWAALRLRFSPSLRVVEASSRVDRVLDAVRAGEPPALPEGSPALLVVWRRKDLAVRHRAADDGEAALLAPLRDGEPFAAACERLAEIVGEERAAGAAAAALSRWLADGLLVS